MPVRPLSKKLQEIAIKELNEVPDRVEEDIKQIQEWLDKQPHLNARRDDQWILSFLRGCKFSLQRTKERLDNFYTMRTLVPEFYENRDPMAPEFQDMLNRGIIMPLSKSSEEGAPPLFLARWKRTDPEKIPYVTLCKGLSMVLDIMLIESDGFSVNGVKIIQDADEYPFNYVFQHTPAVCKKLVHSIQNAYPLRIKGVYFFNVPSFLETIYNIFKPFLSDKFRSRIKLYGKSETNELFKHIPLSILPKEYGGDNKSVDEITAEWKKKVESYRDWFLEEDQYRSDESRRPGNPKTTANVFGVEGSFRKLSVD